MAEDNKAVVRRLLEEVWGAGDLSLLPELLAADCVVEASSAGMRLEGIDQYRQFVATYHALYGEAEFAIESQVAEGDLVASRWTITMELPEDADPAMPRAASGMSFHRLKGGRVIESWDSWDVLAASHLQQEGDLMERLTLGF